MADGSATIDEFIRESLKGTKFPYTGTTTAGRNKIALPDLVLTSDELTALNYKGPIRGAKLCPNVFTGDPSKPADNYVGFMSKCKDELIAANKPAASETVKNTISQAKDAAEYMHKARYADNAKYRIQAAERDLRAIQTHYVCWRCGRRLR